jgi:Domain of unknown function (DUF5666)
MSVPAGTSMLELAEPLPRSRRSDCPLMGLPSRRLTDQRPPLRGPACLVSPRSWAFTTASSVQHTGLTARPRIMRPVPMIANRNERSPVMSSRKPARPIFPQNLRKPVAVVATAIGLGGGAYGIVSATASNGSSTATTATSPATTSRQPEPDGRGSNARSGPAAGGAVGTVADVSTSSFTVSISAGKKVTVNEASSTAYRNGTSSTSASAIKSGERVLVLGMTNGMTITAGQVILQPADGGGSATSSAAAVVPFQRGAPSTAKQVGQIPANYREGSGTIVSETKANKATEAALAAYPGGVVDRVVQLSNGEYEVHNIGVNWPHHVFVNKNFKVVGAD